MSSLHDVQLPDDYVPPPVRMSPEQQALYNALVRLAASVDGLREDLGRASIIPSRKRTSRVVALAVSAAAGFCVLFGLSFGVGYVIANKRVEVVSVAK